MTKIINGNKLAEKIKDKIVQDIVKINDNKNSCPEKRPNLAIILVGEREDSLLYVNTKEKEAKKVGIDTHLYKCPSNIPEREIFEIINLLNNDDLIDAILVQLPLPKGFDTDKIMLAIDPAKDVDCFHPDNLKKTITSCSKHNLLPPVFNVVLEMLKSIKCNLADKQICVVANSNIFGKSLAKTLECRDANISVAQANDKNLKNKTARADILISAVGKPGLITEDMVKEGAVVIDIGTTMDGKKVKGDVDFKNVKNRASYITPVPGGVGPMTIAMLFKNTLELYKRYRE